MIDTPIIIRPSTTTYELLLTSTQQVSHHDPAVQDESNRMLFNRRKQIVEDPRMESERALSQEAMDRLCAANPAPESVAEMLADITGAEFIAVVVVRQFVDLYTGLNAGDGEGLFSGLERYRHLEERLRHAATSASTLLGFWNRLCDTLQVGIHGCDADAALLSVLGLPKPTQAVVLEALATQYRSVVSLARFWHGTAVAARRSEDPEPTVVLSYDAQSATGGTATRAQVLEVPAISGNSVRHQVLREPAWYHLAEHLGLRPGMPGQGDVPASVEALFYNGGNIAAGAKSPTNAHRLAQDIRAAYPSIDLLGGVVNAFDLGASRVQVAAWLVCSENAAALGERAAELPAASLSAFDIIDDVTLTRQAGRAGVGQMIWSFEALASGAQVYVRLSLEPYTPDLTHGAFIAAVETYLAQEPVIGGMRARGFGQVQGEWLCGPGEASCFREAYEAYLAENVERLRNGLVFGTLCTELIVCS